MNGKTIFLLLTASLFSHWLNAQANPIKSFSLKKEPTEIPADTSGTTLFYTVALIAKDSAELKQITFKLKSVSTDSLINLQTFTIPSSDGIYQTGFFPNGLVKDKNALYILLGNIKSKDDLMLYADIKDSKNVTYSNIITTE